MERCSQTHKPLHVFASVSIDRPRMQRELLACVDVHSRAREDIYDLALAFLAPASAPSSLRRRVFSRGNQITLAALIFRYNNGCYREMNPKQEPKNRRKYSGQETNFAGKLLIPPFTQHSPWVEGVRPTAFHVRELYTDGKN